MQWVLIQQVQPLRVNPSRRLNHSNQNLLHPLHLLNLLNWLNLFHVSAW